MATIAKPPAVVETAEPTWDVAHLFPPQGMWSEEEYLELPTNHLVELCDGSLEVLPMPTQSHQLFVAYLYARLLVFLEQHHPGALVLFAPMPVRLRAGKFREPDIVVMLPEHADRRHDQYWERPDLVMEVVSKDHRERDLETKRKEYAAAGIPEYWIVDPQREQIVVLVLAGEQYREHGTYARGARAGSLLFPGFEILVDDVWAAARR